MCKAGSNCDASTKCCVEGATTPDSVKYLLWPNFNADLLTLKSFVDTEQINPGLQVNADPHEGRNDKIK